MADAPDPLGKRALFWAPAERHEAGPRGPEKRVLPGRHALFSGSGPAATVATPKKNGRPRPQLSAPPPLRTRKTTATAPAGRPPRAVARAPMAGVEAPADTAGRNGPISLSCSKCGTHTDVDVLRYVVLHFPLWFWRPGRGYTSLMRCPACGKRAWISASWARPPDPS
ncbi:MAG: hypothetical protein ACRDY1_04170 [Acidimicrobiales bacterium]